MDRKLTTAHLFAGGGGDTQGAIAAGCKPLWAIESDKYAASVYRKRFPNTTLIEADITTLLDEFVQSLEVPDCLIFGSPCPDFSTAGPRAGLKGDRGQLFFEGIRFLEQLRPRLFIFENVEGILDNMGGETFGHVIAEFARLGYEGTWQLKNGNRHVPQNRPRVFVGGFLQGLPLQKIASTAAETTNHRLQPTGNKLFDVELFRSRPSLSELTAKFQWLEDSQRQAIASLFLHDADLWESSTMRVKALSKLRCFYDGKGRRSPTRLDLWGVWGLADGDCSVLTGVVKTVKPKPGKRSLQECLESTAINSSNGQEIEEAFCLPAGRFGRSIGNQKHPNTFVSVKAVKVSASNVQAVEEAPCLSASNWRNATHANHQKGGNAFVVLYKSAGGDRLYEENAPCLRSLASTGGHQSGCGAYKIREFQSQEWIERPLTATEAEQLMGWQEECTAVGITASGQEVQISTTQRLKILGNGIVPMEITEILEKFQKMICTDGK